MACLHPIKIRNKRYTSNSDVEFANQVCDFYNSLGYVNPPDKFIEVPCGKCFGCLKSKRNGWRIRLCAEFFANPDAAAFITLTFDDVSLGRFKDNPNKAIRLFLDRFRKVYAPGVKHFIAAEFGEKNGRLHYHGLLFNLMRNVPLDCDMLSKLWTYGYVYIGYCNQKTINYVSKYITKMPPPGCKLPRLIVSKGMGKVFLDTYGLELSNNFKPYISSNGYKISLPRYYIDKLFDKATRVCMQYYQSLQPFVRYVDGRKYVDIYSYRKALSDYYAKLKSIYILDVTHYSMNREFEKDTDLDGFFDDPFNIVYPDDFSVTPF